MTVSVYALELDEQPRSSAGVERPARTLVMSRALETRCRLELRDFAATPDIVTSRGQIIPTVRRAQPNALMTLEGRLERVNGYLLHSRAARRAVG
jgi:hypothetical protein